METMLLRIFQRQVALQCKFLLRSAIEINAGLKQKNPERVFYALQNLLNSGANISKALWGQRGRLSQQRRLLRDSIGVTDTSPLREVTMRNNFEHLDERLDRWWAESENKKYVDMNVGPRTAIATNVETKDFFRVFDPQTTDLTFWGEEFNIQVIVKEVEKILPKLLEEANKLPWDQEMPKAPEAPKGKSPDEVKGE